jgi:peptidyl-prolyl cis-trans isomerase C
MQTSRRPSFVRSIPACFAKTLIASSAIVMSGVICAATASAADAGAPVAGAGSEAVATVNGEPISNASLQVVMGTILSATPPTQRSDIDDAQTAAREALIKNLAVAQAARKEGLQNNPDIQGIIAYQNAVTLSRAYLKEQLRLHPMTEARVKQEYERALDHGKVQEFHVAHMVFAQKSRAQELLASLAKGEKFATLARLYSQDTNAATNSGDLGWIRIDQMEDYHFVDAVKALKPGAYSKEPVKGPTGWHIIKLLEASREVKADTAPFEKLPKAVLEKIRSRAIQRQIAQIENEILAKASITRASDLNTYAKPPASSGVSQSSGTAAH